jgi:quercetin dioxygenase-like cupin family protein
MRAKIINMENVSSMVVPWGKTRVLVNSKIGAKSLEVRLTEMMPGQIHELHEHAVEEVIVVLSGRGLHIEEEGEEHVIGPNDVIYIPAGVKHKHQCIGTEKLKILVIFAPPP